MKKSEKENKAYNLGLLGYPAKHSKSPDLHNRWLKEHNLTGEYKIYETPPEALQDFLEFSRQSLDGFNVTVPYKTDIYKACDEIDETARLIGAVNTVSVKERKLIGTNTDAQGFIQSVKHAVPDVSFEGKNAMILGAGGAARAVTTGFFEKGVKNVIISNRTKSKAENIAQSIGKNIKVADWQQKEENYSQIDFLVNCTVLGMESQRPLETDISSLNKNCVVCDIVYTPPMTALLQKAKEQNLRICKGRGMLVFQAAAAFEIWTGCAPDAGSIMEEGF